MRWSARFRDPLVLNDGTKLATLRQAGEHLVERYGAVTKDASLGHAMTLLMAAAETGQAEAVDEARQQLELFLRSQRAIGKLEGFARWLASMSPAAADRISDRHVRVLWNDEACPDRVRDALSDFWRRGWTAEDALRARTAGKLFDRDNFSRHK